MTKLTIWGGKSQVDQYKCCLLIESPWCWYTLHHFTLGTKYTVPVIGSFVTAELLLSSCTVDLDATKDLINQTFLFVSINSNK